MEITYVNHKEFTLDRVSSNDDLSNIAIHHFLFVTLIPNLMSYESKFGLSCYRFRTISRISKSHVTNESAVNLKGWNDMNPTLRFAGSVRVTARETS